ncbi:hypothetical protein INR49_027246 [Caranx melampygus]|nr:hypothetical protein INR49_027246 [Caranx melampygus]
MLTISALYMLIGLQLKREKIHQVLERRQVLDRTTSVASVHSSRRHGADSCFGGGFRDLLGPIPH